VSEPSAAPASLARNTIAQSVPRLIGYVLSFASAPVILAGLGLRTFGIWALTGALAQYGSLLDLGVGVSLARYVAANQDDRRRCGEYMMVGWLSVAFIALVLGSLSIATAGVITGALRGVSLANMRVVLACSVVLLCCSMLISVIAAYPIGRRRMVVPNVGTAIGAGINFVASVGSIALGAGLPGYALANAGAGIVSVFVVWALVVRAEGPLPVSRPDRDRVREFLSYSIKNQLVRVMYLVNYQSDKIVIAFSVGPAAAGAYELANRVAIAVREVGIYATSAVDIELTSLMTRFGLPTVRARYERLTEVAVTFGFPPMFLAMATAPLIFAAWLSHAPPYATAVLVALSLAYLLTVSTGVGYSVAVAAGEPGIVARTSVGAGVANIALTVALAPLFGIWGVLAGTVVALSGGALAQVYLIHRRFSIPAASYLDAVVPALRFYAGLAVPVALFSYARVVHGRGVEALALVMLAVLYLAGCAMWAVRAGRLPAAITDRLPRAQWLKAQ
jgi:O-antigen/teichoic acid export membrane protein